MNDISNRNTNKPKAKTTRIQINSKQIKPKTKNQAKIILSKIEDMLNDYNNQDIINMKNNLNIPMIDHSNNETFEIPYSKPKPNTASKNSQPIPQPSRKLNKIKNKRYNKGISFMTDVGLVKQLKSKGEENQDHNTDVYMQCVNAKVNEIINNIDQIDDTHINAKPLESRIEKEGRDFRKLVKDLDDFKNEIHEEFDEVKYLIKFADNTHKLIGRHKNVMTNIFQGAGLRPKNSLFESDKENKASKERVSMPHNNIRRINNEDDNSMNSYSESSEDDDDIAGVFDKLKKINKIKGNLCNIQDNFLGYHQKLKDRIQSNNKYH